MERTIPMKRLPRQLLPRPIHQMANEPDNTPTNNTTTMFPNSVKSVLPNPIPSVEAPPVPIPPIASFTFDSAPNSTIVWQGSNINKNTFAGDTCLNVLGHANFVDYSSGKLQIKADGMYCLQGCATNSTINIVATKMNGLMFETPLLLSKSKQFANITCFLRKDDIVSIYCIPIVNNESFDPNLRIPAQKTFNKPKTLNDVSLSITHV